MSRTPKIKMDVVGRWVATRAVTLALVMGLVVLGYATGAHAAPGDLDPSFGSTGKVTTDFAVSGFGMDIAVQDDDKVVVAGGAYTGPTSGSDFALARYNTDGSLNTSFSNDGRLKTVFGSAIDEARSVAVQTDGKIVAAGYTSDGTNNDFALARYFGSNDDVAPRVTTPTHTLQGATLGTSTVPVRLSWSATDAQGDVTRYELQRSTDGEAYANVALPTPTTTTITQSLTPNHDYRFRVRATDDNGNTTFYKYGPSFTVDAHQERSTSIAYSASRAWKQELLGGSFGGQVKYATAAGSTAKLTFTGTNVAWVAPKSSTRGQAEIYLDNVKVATVDLSSSRTRSRQVLYAANRLSPSVTHTLEVKVLGTSGRPRVDVDAFVVVR
jgi:uncharacterized delta-60 repeat protein